MFSRAFPLVFSCMALIFLCMPLAAQNTNWVQQTGAPTGQAAEIHTRGGDTNIDLTLSPKGNGKVNVSNSLNVNAAISASTATGAWVATQTEAEAGTDAAKIMTPLRVKQAIQASGSSGGSSSLFKNRQIFTASGAWVVPDGVTHALVIVVGGGGGGVRGLTSSGVGSPGGNGGLGGIAVGIVSVTPAESITVTVGAGGNASTNTSNNGSAGGTSSFGTLVGASGGGGGGKLSSPSTGATGVATAGFNLGYFSETHLNSTIYAIGLVDQAFVPDLFGISSSGTNRPAGNGTSATGWSTSLGFAPGARGIGGPGDTPTPAGGVGGAVFVYY